MPFFRIWLCHSNKCVCWKVQGILEGACEQWVMATSRLSAPSCLPTAPCEPHAPYSFFRTNGVVNRNKKATYFIYVSKVGWKECKKEGVGCITLSVGWYHSIRADQFSQTERDKKGASTRRRERGTEEELKWWLYWFVKEIQRCVFCLNIHINLSCQRWAGIYWHLTTQTWIVDFLLGLAVHRFNRQLNVETGKVAVSCGMLWIQSWSSTKICYTDWWRFIYFILYYIYYIA